MQPHPALSTEAGVLIAPGWCCPISVRAGFICKSAFNVLHSNLILRAYRRSSSRVADDHKGALTSGWLGAV